MTILRSLFIALSKNSLMRSFVEKSSIGLRFSSRFVAGLELEDGLAAALQLNEQGLDVTLDVLGESVSSEEQAQAAAAAYHRLLDEIQKQGLKANISVKLTQMGLGLGYDLAFGIVRDLAVHAAAIGSFVRVDMEDSSLTEATIRLVRQIHAQAELRDAIGIVIQAYLYRSEKDVVKLIGDGIRVRLCKGAYKEPARVAFQNKDDVDQNYLKLSRILLESGIYHGLATHDEKMIQAVKAHVERRGLAPSRFEFQMLYGIRRELQRQLVKEGYRVRVYLPFGREWYPYFMRRLAERPANLYFLLKNLGRD